MSQTVFFAITARMAKQHIHYYFHLCY